MAAPPDALLLYEVLAAAFQALVGGLILAAAPRRWTHRAFALLFAINALESLNPDRWLPAPWAYMLGARLLDTYTVLLLVYLMAQFPAPPRGAAARLALRGGVGGAALAWTLLALTAPNLDPERVWPWAKEIMHTAPIVAAGTLLFLRMVPGYLRLDRGPLQTQTLLVACAFGVHFVRLAASALASFALDASVFPARAGVVAQSVLMLYAGYGLVRVLAAAVREPAARSRHVLLAGFLVAGAAIAALDRSLGATLGIGTQELSLYAVRPLLIAYAMVRFDLFTVSPLTKRVVVPMTAGAFLGMGFLLAFRVFAAMGPPLGPDRALSSVGALALVASLGGLAAAVRPRLGLVQAGLDPARIEAYRLALERARLDEPSPAREAGLAALRRTLRVTPEEHDLLMVLLERHVFVPAGSIAAAQPGQVLHDRYEVVRELGRGGFGRALLARERDGGRLVVVKELLSPWVAGSDSARAALRREFESARTLEHPNVARSLALLEDGPQLRLVRAYVAGRTLREVVAQGPLPPDRARQVLHDVLEGLGALHARGLLHLDLKPENVILDERGAAVLIDMGSAAAPLPERATAASPTLSAPRAGTLASMAPEQLTGLPQDARTDVFAAGALLHVMLTGRPHVEGASPYDLERAIVEGAPPQRLPGVPRGLAQVARRALQRAPERRFASAAAMADALKAARVEPAS